MTKIYLFLATKTRKIERFLQDPCEKYKLVVNYHLKYFISYALFRPSSIRL